MAKKASKKKTTTKAATKKTGASGAAASGLIDVGSAAPKFTLTDQDGKTHRLTDYLGKWVVLYFYPKDNTPGCTTEACDFRDAQSDLKRRGAVVLGISPDSEASHRKFVDKHSLHFTLLADPDTAVCKAYGVWGEKTLYGRHFMGIIRTTYLIDPKGKVTRRWDKVKVKGHAAEVAAAMAACAG